MNECCVCYENVNLISFQCQHTLCTGCLRRLCRANCPVCCRDISGEIDVNDLNAIKIREIQRHDEIDDEVLDTAVKQLDNEESSENDSSVDEIEDNYEDEDIEEEIDEENLQQQFNMQLFIADEYLDSSLPEELLAEIAMEESLGK